MATINGGKAALLGGATVLLTTVAIGASFILPTDVPAPPAVMPQPAAAEEPTVAPAVAYEPQVTGWMPYWDLENSMTTVEQAGEKIEEASPFWYELVTSGKRVEIRGNPLPAGTSRSDLTLELQQNGVAVIPTITDATPAGALSQYLKNSKKRRALAKTIVDLVRVNGYDGVDLNWENFAFADGSATWDTTRARWVKFVATLSKRLHKSEKVLAVTTPAMTGDKDGYWVYDWRSISDHIDRLRIMTYDYSVNYPGAIGPIWWAERTLKYANRVVDPNKIQIGVAAYGRNWVTKIDGLCPSSANVRRTTVSPADARKIARETKAKVTWNREASEATFTYQRKYKEGTLKCTVTREVWYPTVKSLRQRLNLAEQYGINGIAIWPLGDTPAAFLR